MSLLLAGAIADRYRERRHKVPLAYRGAISHGRYFVDPSGRFLLGPAIDRAAELHDRAQGAFVWFDESARDALGSWPDDVHPVVTRWKVPVKQSGSGNSRTIDTVAVSPLWNNDDPDGIRRSLIATFDRLPLDATDAVREKLRRYREHTEAFLDRALADLRAWDGRTGGQRGVSKLLGRRRPDG